MKFFKHFTDAHRGRSMQAILSKLGHKGHSVWWLLVEVCAEKMSKHKDEEYTEEHCVFEFQKRYLAATLQVHRHSDLEMYLRCYRDVGLMSLRCDGDVIEISMPKLLESLDRDTKRARPERGPVAPKRKREEKEKEKDTSESTDSDKNALHQFAQLWNLYCGDLPKVVRSKASRNKQMAARFKDHSLDEWVEIIERIAKSDFCNGKGNTQWIATFDWLLRPDTSLRVLEGKYDNRKAELTPAKQDQWIIAAQRVATALKRSGQWTKDEQEVRDILVKETLWKICMKAGVKNLRETPPGEFYLRNIAGKLKEAYQIMNVDKSGD